MQGHLWAKADAPGILNLAHRYNVLDFCNILSALQTPKRGKGFPD